MRVIVNYPDDEYEHEFRDFAEFRAYLDAHPTWTSYSLNCTRRDETEIASPTVFARWCAEAHRIREEAYREGFYRKTWDDAIEEAKVPEDWRVVVKLFLFEGYCEAALWCEERAGAS